MAELITKQKYANKHKAQDTSSQVQQIILNSKRSTQLWSISVCVRTISAWELKLHLQWTWCLYLHQRSICMQCTAVFCMDYCLSLGAGSKDIYHVWPSALGPENICYLTLHVLVLTRTQTNTLCYSIHALQYTDLNIISIIIDFLMCFVLFKNNNQPPREDGK